MILGGTVSLLLLLGGPQAPPEDRPTSGSGPLAEYPIEIGDPGDMGGGGGGGYKNCKIKRVGPAQLYRVEYDGGHSPNQYDSEQEAKAWGDANCDPRTKRR